MKISATIVSFNTRELLSDCLSRVRSSDLGGHELEILVVDNASHDGSADLVASRFPEVTLVRSAVNLGFAAGQNAAIRRATGDAVLVLNSDVLVEPDTIRELADALSARPSSVGVVGPRVVGPDGALATSGRRVRRSAPAILLAETHRVLPLPGWTKVSGALRRAPGAHRLHDNFRADSEVVRRVGYVDGMAAMFRRSALEQVGLFDEQFFFDCEILDLAIRLANAGFSQEVVPSTTVVHVGGASRDQLGGVALLTNESKLRFHAKHYPQNYRLLRGWLITMLRVRLAGPALAPAHREALESMLATATALSDPNTAIDDVHIPRLPQGRP